MKRLLRLTSAVLVLLVLSLPLFAGGRRKNAALTISNFSQSQIRHLYIAESYADDWGADRLRGRVLTNTQSFTVGNLPCDVFDVKIVDQDGDECIYEEVELCAGTTHWRLTDKDLDECEGE
jgi:hypothetical protein